MQFAVGRGASTEPSLCFVRLCIKKAEEPDEASVGVTRSEPQKEAVREGKSEEVGRRFLEKGFVKKSIPGGNT